MKNSIKTKSSRDMMQEKWENGCIDGKPLVKDVTIDLYNEHNIKEFMNFAGY